MGGFAGKFGGIGKGNKAMGSENRDQAGIVTDSTGGFCALSPFFEKYLLAVTPQIEATKRYEKQGYTGI